MKVLVVQNRMGIGDMVIFLPYIEAISKHFNVPVSLLVKENTKCSEYLSDNPNIDNIITLDRDDKKKFGKHYGLKGIFNLAFEIKKYLPDTITIIGGFHATFLPEQTLKEFPTFDYVSVGESEVSWSKLADAILNNNGSPKDIKGIWYEENGKIIKMGRGEIPETLDELGEPGWHLFDQEIIHKYAGEIPIMAKRGCPFSCNFCSRPYGQDVRLRSPKLIVDEIEKNQKRYNINFVNFWDETFTINKLHTKALCQEIIKRKQLGKTY